MAPSVSIDFGGRKEFKNCSLANHMGKSRKYTKGQSTGFVPNCRHAVETMAECEMTASDDSCAPKRKCISLNVGENDHFDVPKEVLSLSRLSKSELKDLDRRLKKELERLRALQGRLSSLNLSGELISSLSDIRSANDGKRPLVAGLSKPAEASVTIRGKRGGSSVRNRLSGKKGRADQSKAYVATASSNTFLMKQCETLLCRLMSHQFGWIFNVPVDTVKLNIPDYHTIIKHPMDLGTVKKKLISGVYPSPIEFVADVRLTFANAMKYNPPGNDVHYMADTLSKFFEVRWKAIEKKLPQKNDMDNERAEEYTQTVFETIIDAQPSKKAKVSRGENSLKCEPLTMTDEAKHKLSMDLMDSIGDLPLPIIDFLKSHCPQDELSEEDEIELDLDALNHEALFKLRKLLDDHILEKRKAQQRIETSDIERLNESRLSNSSLHHGKVTGTVEEVDAVGGNDHPVSTSAQIEVVRDGLQKRSTCSSSSSSSSDSGSSSDAAETSESDSEHAKADKTENAGGAVVDAKGSGDGESFTGSRNEEGENALPDKPVSPDKAYRAAILRGRFADTILKAREKALDKIEKQDPSMIRLEREKLERRQKEERARLQAEAKAAEEARRLAEAEAAAEARKKRELQREAARKALVEMEKTVDINENSHFMEDLEMLTAGNDESSSSFAGEASPDLPHNCMGSFKLHGTANPLQQLGLYMKDDAYEEDDVPSPNSAPDVLNDIEEGEID